jgi:lipopolysaccharide/colanic/teichoic acid biosynthesis glycosyltransferase
MYRRYLKRLLDIVFSFAAILCFGPLFIIIALLILMNLGSPVIFRQKRPGMNERIFTLYKFRTMTAERGESGELLPDGMRATAFGNRLRSSSLDEIPQLVNILLGDMSFVGPRPLLPGYLPFYTADERVRHSVRPGLTGRAQISGRNTLGWDARLKKDIEYVRDLCVREDFKIIYKTVRKVLRKENILNRDEDRLPDLSVERSGLVGGSVAGHG